MDEKKPVVQIACMNTLKIAGTLGLISLLSLAGCHSAKSPDAVANDVAAAQQSAAGKIEEKSKDLNNSDAKGAYDVALAKADGDHKVALEKCEALNGDAQTKCKDMADADYDATKANAKASEVAAKQ
jgi:hypothetical protein